jgi:crotonobetainyl-CoA:carnitine CoA-transferase CaiB-like acyl-CoA transferase
MTIPAVAVQAAEGPLAWLRVVDLTDLRGALCARILADLGADVVRVEQLATPAQTSAGSAHKYRNANKRGVTLDLTTPEGRGRLDRLLQEADVLVDNLDSAARLAAGLSAESVAQTFPHLVHVALTDLGLRGPRSAWHLEALPALAASGALHASGFPDLPPCNAPGYLAHDCASVYGAVAAVAAALDAERRGGARRGQLVDISVQEAALAGTNPWSIALHSYSKLNPLLSPEGKRNAEGAYWVLPAADGWVRAVIGTRRHWEGFVDLMRSPDALLEEVWASPHFRLQNADVVRLIAEERLTDRTRAQLFDEALGRGTTVGVLHTVREFADHPQTRARSFFLNGEAFGLGGLPFAGHPVNLSRTPAALRLPAAAADADSDEVSFRARRPPAGSPIGKDGGLLLDGVRVVEFGVAAVVPELAGVLSELGADVIKIESRAHPDVLRAAGAATGSFNSSMTFNCECRGRRSVALDLTTPEGRRLAFELCAAADVVAENHRGGVLDALGLGYDAVQARNPGVIYVSSQGYGRTGPFATMPAYGPLNSGFSGMHLLWNHPDAPYPCGTSLNHPDHIGGKLLAVPVLAALREREASGRGQRLEMAQTEVAAYLMGESYLDAARADADPVPLGNAHPSAAPHGVYPSAGDDRWVAVAVMNDEQWLRLCAVAGWEATVEFATSEARLAARAELDAQLSEWTRGLTNADAAELLQAGGVSAMPVMGPVDHHADPHLQERDFIVHLDHPEVGEETHVGNPIRFSRLEQRMAKSAPCLGAHTEEVLTSLLGLTSQEVEALVEKGVCR